MIPFEKLEGFVGTKGYVILHLKNGKIEDGEVLDYTPADEMDENEPCIIMGKSYYFEKEIDFIEVKKWWYEK